MADPASVRHFPFCPRCECATTGESWCPHCREYVDMPRCFVCPRCTQTVSGFIDVGEGWCPLCKDFTVAPIWQARFRGARGPDAPQWRVPPSRPNRIGFRAFGD